MPPSPARRGPRRPESCPACRLGGAVSASSSNSQPRLRPRPELRHLLARRVVPVPALAGHARLPGRPLDRSDGRVGAGEGRAYMQAATGCLSGAASSTRSCAGSPRRRAPGRSPRGVPGPARSGRTAHADARFWRADPPPADPARAGRGWLRSARHLRSGPRPGLLAPAFSAPGSPCEGGPHREDHPACDRRRGLARDALRPRRRRGLRGTAGRLRAGRDAGRRHQHPPGRHVRLAATCKADEPFSFTDQDSTFIELLAPAGCFALEKTETPEDLEKRIRAMGQRRKLTRLE